MSGKLHRTSRGVKHSGFTDNQKGQHTPISALVSSTISCSLCHSESFPSLFPSFLQLSLIYVLQGTFLLLLVSHIDWKEEMG